MWNEVHEKFCNLIKSVSLNSCLRLWVVVSADHANPTIHALTNIYTCVYYTKRKRVLLLASKQPKIKENLVQVIGKIEPGHKIGTYTDE